MATGKARDGNPAMVERLRDIILRLAAYRATHGGRDPPANSALAREKETLRRLLPRRKTRWSALLMPWRRVRDACSRTGSRPLRPYLVERSFLTDDYRESDVVARLEAWPMVTAYRPEGRVFTGEWFTYTMEVKAESARRARFLVDCIFAAEPRERSPGGDGLPPDLDSVDDLTPLA